MVSCLGLKGWHPCREELLEIVEAGAAPHGSMNGHDALVLARLPDKCVDEKLRVTCNPSLGFILLAISRAPAHTLKSENVLNIYSRNKRTLLWLVRDLLQRCLGLST
jgi:hypothetical protein